VDIILKLLSKDLASQLAARNCFRADAPLLKYRLIELTDESVARQSALLARLVKLDEGIVAYLLGEDGLDLRLQQLAELVLTEQPYILAEESQSYCDRLVEMASEFEQGFTCALTGADYTSKRYLVSTVCHRLGKPVLVLKAELLPPAIKAEPLLALVARECMLRGAALYIEGYDSTLREEPVQQELNRLLLRMIREQHNLTFVSSTAPLAPLSVGRLKPEIQLSVGLPSYTERQQLWESLLGSHAAGMDLQSLSSRFRLSNGQIVAAVDTAYNIAAWRGDPIPTINDLEVASRRHSNQRLSVLARKITPTYKWGDIVLPPDQTVMLREICDQVKNRALVYEAWGFDKKLSMGKGLNIIFAGPSGTGKTMSAEIIGSELKMDIYKIDLSNVVSKYIGETEKNLDKIFNEAGESNGILFFDEADSIFGKRSEVKDAHDRYANIETGYLLQKMEEYDGIVILATNLRKNLDDAFVRRMHFMIEYPFPQEEDRLEIWRRVFPKDTPMAADADLSFMARQFKMAGGNIKNIALAAAFLAAAGSGEVGMLYLIQATRREYQKMGKLCTESDFGPYFKFINDTNKVVPPTETVGFKAR
jgi:hypothetical protein